MPVRYAPITITLHEDTVLPDGPRAGNSTRSTPALTGRALRGMVSRTLRRRGVPDEVHDRIVLSGAVSFTAAHPLTHDGQVCLPRPLCLRVRRDEGDVFDLSDPNVTVVPGLSRPDGELVAVGPYGEFTHWVSVARVSRGRIQRDRARGRPTEDTGGPFHVSALAAGQVFRAWWRVSADTEQQLATLVDDDLFEIALGAEEGIRIGLGRAKDTAHGGDAEVELHAPVDRTLDIEVPAFAPGADLWVLLLAPALVVDPHTGDYHPDALGDAVAERFAGRVRVRSVWTAPHLTGGYNAKWRGHVPEEWAAAAGSVVRCEVAAPDGLAPEHILAAEHRPLGEHWVDGYGAFVVLNPPEEWTLPGSHTKRVPVPDTVDEHIGDDVVIRMLAEATDVLCWRRLDPVLRDAAARSARESRNMPAPSLLGRLRDSLHVAGDARQIDVAERALTGLSTVVGSVADKAARDLDAAMIARPGRQRVPMRRWLTELAGRPETLVFDRDGSDALGLTPHVAPRVFEGSDVDSRVAEAWLREHAAPIAVRYLDEWFRQATLTAKENMA